jgi:glycosyltransferase involved in cell wall biosynthesis
MLAENEACPNVVLEALASGLPVLYRDSGGTGELVEDCGRPVTPETFGDALDWVLDRRRALGEAARRRAEERFAPGIVFPRYLDAIATAGRRPLPPPWTQVALLRLGPRALGKLFWWGAGRLLP